jgi:hypothetical protein
VVVQLGGRVGVAAARVVNVNADRPLEHVLCDVKHAVWESI